MKVNAANRFAVFAGPARVREKRNSISIRLCDVHPKRRMG